MSRYLCWHFAAVCQTIMNLGQESPIGHLVPEVSFWMTQWWPPCSGFTTGVCDYFLTKKIEWGNWFGLVIAQPLGVGGVELLLQQGGKIEGGTNSWNCLLCVVNPTPSQVQLRQSFPSQLNHVSLCKCQFTSCLNCTGCYISLPSHEETPVWNSRIIFGVFYDWVAKKGTTAVKVAVISMQETSQGSVEPVKEHCWQIWNSILTNPIQL